MDGERHRVKLVDNCEPRFFAAIVDAGDVDQVIEREIVTTEFGDFAQIARQDCVSGFAAEFRGRLELWAKQFS
jgi:hypothetical protein